MRDQFRSIAEDYNDIYFKEDTYERESKMILSLIRRYKKSDGNILLDVACGTGTHVKFFAKKYKVYGLDYSREMLMIARKKYPDVKFFRRNMVDFHLKLIFDVILCLYGSIGLGSRWGQIFAFCIITDVVIKTLEPEVVLAILIREFGIRMEIL